MEQVESSPVTSVFTGDETRRLLVKVLLVKLTKLFVETQKALSEPLCSNPFFFKSCNMRATKAVIMSTIALSSIVVGLII